MIIDIPEAVTNSLFKAAVNRGSGKLPIKLTTIPAASEPLDGLNAKSLPLPVI
jgi:hypothetical protein